LCPSSLPTSVMNAVNFNCIQFWHSVIISHLKDSCHLKGTGHQEHLYVDLNFLMCITVTQGIWVTFSWQQNEEDNKANSANTGLNFTLQFPHILLFWITAIESFYVQFMCQEFQNVLFHPLLRLTSESEHSVKLIIMFQPNYIQSHKKRN